MLILRNAQLETFHRNRVRQFLDQMVEYIEREYPRHYSQLTQDGTRAFVERSVDAAKRLGMTGDGAIGALLELWLVYGEALERAPDREWAKNILAHKELPDYIKVEALQNRFQERTGGRSLVVFAPSP